ncbi:hypothetical protein Arnit_1581 [Arcobacter nitrofigilis DSM 7299]|uniref:Uncharacterized protein n=1 Tax=Arcobacter nitrofigilis (strain ATCC 33309 / DSM 7299 / CCUG 15893 / LMG 7604 / NCTC 12251 / CI) TaxID=572480 RepID=D5V668_ARCNC|nr:hypothetical protein [Arcobacter nitrofigilis]ADG93235.1 hypothetical protein Arnit_1581 [Arcobacter nitrofigilis DSM 7299]
MSKKSKVPFDPNSFDSITTIGNIIENFPKLLSMDFSKTSLNEELSRLNYEIISSKYKDFQYSNIKDCYDYEVDKIV